MTPDSNVLGLPALALFELHPLAYFQQKAKQQDLAQLRLRPRHYTIVLVEEALAALHLINPVTEQPALSVYFISPGQLAAAHPTGLNGMVMQFTEEFFCHEADIRDFSLMTSLFHRAVGEASLQISRPDSESLVFLANGLRQESKSPGLRKEALVRTYLKAFLIHCLRLREKQGPIRPQSMTGGLFLKFRRILEEHYTVHKTVVEYAERLHVTANHLSETIKKETGRTAGSHIRHRVISEAQRLADSSSLTLKEIAYQLGYDDVAHFSRLFKRCVGINFSQYKGRLVA